MKTENEFALCQTMPNNPNKSIYDRFFFQKQIREKGERKRLNNHDILKILKSQKTKNPCSMIRILVHIIRTN